MLAELLEFFVQGKTRWHRRDFEQHAAGFAEINGMKIRPIDHWRDVITKLDEMFAPLELFGFILRPERNMMHRSRRDAARLSVGHAKQINDSARRRVVRRRKAKSVS